MHDWCFLPSDKDPRSGLILEGELNGDLSLYVIIEDKNLSSIKMEKEKAIFFLSLVDKSSNIKDILIAFNENIAIFFPAGDSKAFKWIINFQKDSSEVLFYAPRSNSSLSLRLSLDYSELKDKVELFLRQITLDEDKDLYFSTLENF